MLAAEEEEVVASLQHFASAVSYIREAFNEQHQQVQESDQVQPCLHPEEHQLQQHELQQQQDHLLQLLLRSDFVARHAAACLLRRPLTPEETPQAAELKESIADADKELRKDIECAMQQLKQQQQAEQVQQQQVQQEEPLLEEMPQQEQQEQMQQQAEQQQEQQVLQ